MADDATIYGCRSCGHANRLPVERLGDNAKCGVCGAPLLAPLSPLQYPPVGSQLPDEASRPVIEPSAYRHEKEEKNRRVVDATVVARGAIVSYYRHVVEPMRIPDLIAMVQAGRSQFANLDADASWMADMLGLKKPNVFIYYMDSYGVFAEGLSSPWICISSKCVEELASNELRFLLAREMVRIQCAHQLYDILIDQMLDAAGFLNRIPMVGTVLGVVGPERVKQALKLPFYRYTRVVEHTVDRGAWLVTGKLYVAANAIMKQVLRSGALASKSSVAAWFTQARTLDSMTGMVASYTKADERMPYGPYRLRDLVQFASRPEAKRMAQRTREWRRERGVDE